MKKIKNLFLLRWYSIGLRLIGELILVLYIILTVYVIIVDLFENGGLFNSVLVSEGGIFISTSISLICFSQLIDWSTRVYDNIDSIKKKVLNQPIKVESNKGKFYSKYNLFTVIIILVSIGLFLIHQISFPVKDYTAAENEGVFEQIEYSKFDNTKLERLSKDLIDCEVNETALKLEIVELKKEIRFRDSIQYSLDQLDQLRGAISFPETVLYRGYDNKVTGKVSEYPKYNLVMTNGTITKSGDFWIAKPGRGKESTIAIEGTSSDGKSASLGSFKFEVRNLPDPDVSLGSIQSGDRVSKGAIYTANRFFAKYGPEVPLSGVNFKIKTWELNVSGASRPIRGAGATLNSIGKSLLRQAPRGGIVTINITVVGPDGALKRRNMSFTIF